MEGHGGRFTAVSNGHSWRPFSVIDYDFGTVDVFWSRERAQFAADELNCGNAIVAPHEPIGSRVMPRTVPVAA